MTDGIKFKGTDGVYVLTKQGKDGKKAMIIVRDSNSNSKLDNNDGFTVSDPTSIFTAGEILSALDRQKYVANDNGKSGLSIVPAIDKNGKIAVKNDQQYNFGSFVKTLRKMKDQDSAVFAPTEVSPAKTEAPAPAAAETPASAAAPASNIDPSAMPNHDKWVNILSSLLGSSYYGNGDVLNFQMSLLLNAMLAEANGGANIDYSAMPDVSGYSDIAIPAMPAIPAADQSGAAVAPAQTAAQAFEAKKAEAKAAGVVVGAGDTEVTLQAKMEQKAADDAFTKTKQLATKLGITIDPTDTNETLNVKIKDKSAEVNKKAAEDANVGITSELFTSMKGLGTDNLGSSVNKITKDNVIEIMQIWDSSYKDSMGGDSLLEAINNEWCFGKTKWLGMGDTSILTTIQQALVARAKDLGLGRDAQAFNDLVSKEINAPIWTSDRDVEAQFEKMRQAIKAKEKEAAK